MRWFVNRDGETIGPIDETELVAMVRGGLRNASVRDESGGAWMPVAQSPFAGQLPPDPAALRARTNARVVLLLLVLGLGLFWWKVCNSFEASKKESDAKFCSEWLAYYTSFCKAYPAKCEEGPRKLARCDP